MIRPYVFLLVVVLVSCFFSGSLFAAAPNDSAVKVKWGYKGNLGPERWGQLDPRFRICASGKWQSPINMAHIVKTIPNTLVVHYQPAPIRIMDDGDTTLMIGHIQTIVNEGHGIQLNFPSKGVSETITLDGKKFRLVQFHLHSPSENQLNGSAFPLEIHFVHQGKDGQLVVIGVFVTSGRANKTVDQIIKNIPKEKGIEIIVKKGRIHPLQLMPSNHAYFRFMGSLTTPPCSEGVQWIVMPSPILASPAQIVQIREALGGGNARPIQALNHRTISYSSP